MVSKNLEKNTNIVINALNWSYDKAVNGFNTFCSTEELGESYLKSNEYNHLKAINSLIR